MKCHFDESKEVTRVTGSFVLREGEEILQEGVATIGPLVVMIDATHQGFQFYR